MSVLFDLDNGGESTTSLFVKFDARNGMWSTGEDPINLKEKNVIFCTKTLQTGWMRWVNGDCQTEFSYDLVNKIAKPADDSDDPQQRWKQAFSVELLIDGDRKIWSSSAIGVLRGLQELYPQISAGGGKPGQEPQIQYKGAEKQTIGKGTTHKPKFEVIGWVDVADDDEGAASDIADNFD